MNKYKITEVKFNREFVMHGTPMFSFGIKVEGNGDWMEYISKSKDQTKFKVNEEVEATISKVQRGENVYQKIKPFYAGKGNSNYSKSVNREQSKYSGFAMSYAKDLVVCGTLKSTEDMFKYADMMFKWMVEKDKEVSNG